LINQSINKFISRHSTEARATVRLCRIKEKCQAWCCQTCIICRWYWLTYICVCLLTYWHDCLGFIAVVYAVRCIGGLW